MSRSIYRLPLAALALAIVAGGVLVSLRTSPESVVAANAEYIIDILPGGFNPPFCQVDRANDGGATFVRFRNKDTKARRLIVPDVSVEPTAPPLEDTGPIPAGTVSEFNIGITGNYDRTFRDADDPKLTIRIYAPQSPNSPANCSPLPPTPTPTPTRTPTPKPTPTQRPPACMGLAPVSRQPITGCSIAPDVTQGE